MVNHFVEIPFEYTYAALLDAWFYYYHNQFVEAQRKTQNHRSKYNTILLQVNRRHMHSIVFIWKFIWRSVHSAFSRAISFTLSFWSTWFGLEWTSLGGASIYRSFKTYNRWQHFVLICTTKRSKWPRICEWIFVFFMESNIRFGGFS